MNLAAFEGLLRQTMGLDAASIGSSAVERAVQARAAACRSENWHAYWELLSVTPSELQELIEAVVIPETWFFRDREAFAAMTRAAEESLGTNGGRDVRLLSLPCATGEEPYSMAMALVESGMPADRFHIDAVDISARSLARATGALYGKNSFRGEHLGFRDRYFIRETQGYRLADRIRRQVHFAQANLFDSSLMGDGIYDVVFCRNLLIYFDAPTQIRAINLLAGLLRQDGFLFVGPSETSLLVNFGFRSLKVALAFALKKGAPSATPKAAPGHVARSPKRATSTPASTPSVRPATSRSLGQPVLRTLPPAKTILADVHSLADQGHLAEAARHCEEYLRENGASAEALFLLGIIRDAAGSLREAADLYRKAVYLDPGHNLALSHLSLLLQRQGDAAGAKAVNDRLRRLNHRSVKHDA
jgi:chemotaxis protein methyltransferase WspC